MSNLAHKKPIVYTSGSFDDIHTIDIRFLQEASRLGAVRVLLFSDALVMKEEGKPVKFPQAERLYYLKNIRFIDDVRIIDTTDFDAKSLTNNDQDRKEVYWAMRESDASSRIIAYWENNGLTPSIVPDAALAGFPLKEPRQHNFHKKVMVSGCFDWVHSGHVRFFEQAAEYGDLYVVVGHDENLRLLKGKSHPLFSQEERQYWVHAIRFVHKALISSGNGWLDAEPEVLKYKPDIFIVNEDGDKPEKKKLFKKLGIEYLVLKRKPKEGLKARQSTHLRGF